MSITDSQIDDFYESLESIIEEFGDYLTGEQFALSKESDPEILIQFLEEVESFAERNSELYRHDDFVKKDILFENKPLFLVLESQLNGSGNWDLYDQLQNQIVKKYHQKEYSSGTYYHGTYWEISEEPHFEVDSGYNDDEVSYVSEKEAVAVHFSTELGTNKTNLEKIPVVFRVSLGDLKVIEFDLSDKFFRHNNEDHRLYYDRNQYFPIVESEYDAFVIRNFYHEQDYGSDIALFSSIAAECISSVKMRINGSWTEYMEPDKASELFDKLKSRTSKPKATI